MLKYEIEPYWQLSAFLQQVVKGEMTNMWPLRITYVWTIPEVFLTNNTIMPWVFFSPKCYSLNVSVYQLPNYAIKIALRLPTAHKIGEKQTHTACNFLPMSPFDESYSWKAGVPPCFFQTLWKDDNSVSQMGKLLSSSVVNPL